MEIIQSKSVQDTRAFGRAFAENLRSGDVVGFFGDLGSGKTQIIQGICEFFNVEESVNSPTFIIQNQYLGILSGRTIEINHFDFYRIDAKKEWDDLGLQEYLFDEKCICLVEWAERIEMNITQSYWKISLKKTAATERRIEYDYIRH